jgi:hypothetical protein
MSDASSNATRKDDRREFMPVAQRYRCYGRVFMTCVFGAIASAFLSSLLRYDPISLWFIAFVPLCILAGFVTVWLAPPLRCPTCHTNAGGALKRYCPECGGSPLEETWLLPRRCTSCGKRLVRGMSRRYRVRFCTCCGAYLDESGS